MKQIRICFDAKNKSSFINFIVCAFLIVIQFSCTEESVTKKEARPEATLEKLQLVHAKTLERIINYNDFLKQAGKEKKTAIKLLFTALKRSEEIHAKNQFALLQKHNAQPISVKEEKVITGSSTQTLKMALSMEDLSTNSVYPALIKLADCEKCTDALQIFKITQDSEFKHAELLRYAIYQGSGMPKLNYKVCPACGYILTTEDVIECPACKGMIKNFESI
ncbi:MAG: rubrerythrin family protein [Ignavibacteriales bacterium]|nr:rubrerythrin family protein [Ignavibacteriales bacterium]